MYWFKTSLLLLIASPAFAVEGFIAGIGVESDSADGLSLVVIGGIGFTEKTWLSGSVAKNTVDLPRDLSLDTTSADIGLDHWFEPVGIRVGVATWGDNNILDSNDVNGSLYWRSDRLSISGELEFRDFEFNIPGTDFFPGRNIDFDATGLGLTTRFKLNEMLSLSFSGIEYDYNVNLGLDSNQAAADLLSASRLSIVNNLIDYRAGVGLGLDVGNQQWSLDYSQRKGAVDGSTTDSVTLSFLTPTGEVSDLEIGLGFDDSDVYGSVTFISVFLYFYGGN